MNAGYHLDDNERILYKINRHWIELVPLAVTATTLLAVVLGGMYLYGRYGYLVPQLPAVLVWTLALLILLMAGVIVGIGLFVYRQNLLILTNLHLIQVEQRGLFNRAVAQLSLARVQDVTGRRTGMLATMLDYGNVEVQSAGEQDKFTFRNAPSPQALADRCLEAHEVFSTENPQRAAEGTE